MRSPRRAAFIVIVAGAFFAASIAITTHSLAQKKPDPQKPDQPAEKPTQDPQQKELLTVQPVATQTPPADQGKKPSTSTKIQLPEGGVDDKNPIITNTDLITFNVTVTDIYGRFVSGLNKNAFSVVDEKLPQEITFFSDEDAPVSVGILFDV